MEAVGQNPTLGDDFSNSEPAEHNDPDEETLKGNPRTSGSVENAQENGSRVFKNAKEGFSGDLGVGFGKKVKKKVDKIEISGGNGTATENFDVSGVEAEGLEDSEMNGVSSLLKMRQDFDEKENCGSFDTKNAQKTLDGGEVGGLNGNNDGKGEEEEEEEEEEGETDDEENRFRVGDFVWGKIKSHPWWPGQIYDSSNASELALKIKQKGRLLVAYFGDGTFAWCHPTRLKPFEENFIEFSKISSSKIFLNAIEDAVEEMGRQVENMMTCSYIPKDHLNTLARSVAENSGIREGVLVPETRKETISGLKFEPQEILGELKKLAKFVTLSDLLEYEMLKRKISAFYRVKVGHSLPEYYGPQPVPGLEEESTPPAVKLHGFYGLSEEDRLNSGKSDQISSDKHSRFPEDRLYHRRKQKSIAEILETDMNLQARGDINSVSSPLSGERKRRCSSKVTDGNGDETLTSAIRRRRQENVGVAGGKEVIVASARSSKRKNKDSGLENDSNGKKEEEENFDETSPLSSLRKKIKIDVSNVEKDNINRSETNPQTPNDSLSRERKKSKYLSPPYTTEFSGKGKRNEIEAESLRVSNEARVGERMTNAASHLVEVIHTKPSNEIENDSGPRTPKRKALDFSKVDAMAKLMDLIRTAALSPQYAKGTSSNDLICEFMATYRNSKYHDGSKDEMQKKTASARKKESKKIGTDENKAAKPRKEREPKPEKSKQKQEIGEMDAKTENNTVTEQVSNAEVHIMFGSGSSLPTKNDLIKIYEKFGDINKEGTAVFNKDFCARVAFLNTSDAEEAFKSSLNANPFAATSSSVSFRLRYPSALPPNNPSENRFTKELRKPESAPAQKTAADADFNYVKEKIEAMRGMLEDSEGKITLDLKIKLETEIRNLLEKVNKMVASSSSS